MTSIPTMPNITSFKDIAMNTLIIAAVTAWIVAQTTKVLCGFIRYGLQDRSRVMWRILWAGGMPSSHSAFITAAVFTIFLTYGAESSIFGFALIMSCIIIYDICKMHTIYSTFQNKYPALKEEVQNNPVLKDLVGHRLPEVLAGIMIGLGSGLATFVYL